MLAVVQRGLSTFVIRHSGLTVSSGARTGAVTLIQRFGPAPNLNIHLHMRFLDGAYTCRGCGAVFHRARRLTDFELAHLLDSLSRRIVGLLERRGLLIADPERPQPDFEPGSSPDQIQAASITRHGFTRALLGLRPNRTLVLACAEDPPLVVKILAHVHCRETLTGSTARGPPTVAPT